MERLAQEIIDLLQAKAWYLSTVESCTAGMLFSTLTAIAGASAVLDRGFITYSNQAKMDMVDVDATCLKTHGAVSAETALQMAQGGLAKSRAELSISITGIAGPGGGSAEKPVGLVYIGRAMKGRSPQSWVYNFCGDRQKIRQEATKAACMHIMESIK